MSYCFEARFRLARPIPLAEKIEEEFQAATFKQPLQLSRAYGMNTYDGWLVCQIVRLCRPWRSESRWRAIPRRAVAQRPTAYTCTTAKMELADPGLPLPTVLTEDDLKATPEFRADQS
jgi:hypothetical protein